MDLNISRPNGLLVGQPLLLYSSAAGARVHGQSSRYLDAPSMCAATGARWLEIAVQPTETLSLTGLQRGFVHVPQHFTKYGVQVDLFSANPALEKKNVY